MQATKEKTTAEDIEDNKMFFKYQENRPRMLEREWLEMFPEAKEFLEDKLVVLEGIKSEVLKKCKEEYARIVANELQDFDKWFAMEMLNVWYFRPLEDTEKHIKKIKWQIAPPREDKNTITPEQIDRAKSYPFERLVGLDKSVGWVKCPFHTDNNPSFYVKNNWGHCFSCSRSVDTIQYMIEVNGMSFKNAVLALQ